MRRIRLHRSEAIVLKRHDFGEADRLLTLYTPDRGKVKVVAKGIRKIASRKSGHLELFTHATLLLAEGRELDVVTQADTLHAVRRIREDLVRTTYAYHMAELVDRMTELEQGNLPLFELLRDSLIELETAEDPSLVVRYFELHLMSLLGYQPQLFACVVCGRTLEVDGNGFSSDAGGVVCPDCFARHPDTVALTGPAFRVLRFLQTREWSHAGGLHLTPATRGETERIMHAYIRHLLERDLNSVRFLRGLRQVAEELDLRPGGESSGGKSGGDPTAD